jgi:hypothetical protein
VAVRVLTSSVASLLTLTVSCRPPTSSVAVTLAGTPACTRTSLSTVVLNPCSDTVTVYLPVCSAGTLNVPVEFVMASNLAPVSGLVTTTIAPGTTPPAESLTTPAMDDVTWRAHAGLETKKTRAASVTIRTPCLMSGSSSKGPWATYSELREPYSRFTAPKRQAAELCRPTGDGTGRETSRRLIDAAPSRTLMEGRARLS